MNRAVLARPVESEDVVPALDAGARAFGVQFFGRTIEAGMHEEERAPSIGLVDAMEVTGEGGVLVGDFYGKNGRIAKGAAGLVGLNRFLVSTVNAWIVGITVEEKL